MGRVKLKLKTAESETGRIVTYSKRKNALLKKTNELAVLCEIEVVLLMFSPTGRVSLQMGNAVKFDQIVRRFANTSAEERARSNMKVFETLKKSYKNSDHEVHAKYFSVTSKSRSVEDLNAQSNLLQSQLAKTQQRLSDWKNADKIDDIELLGQMENYLKGLVHEISSQKKNILKKGSFTSAGSQLRYPGDGHQNIASTFTPSYLFESSYNVGSHLRFPRNNFQNIASMSTSVYGSRNVGFELRFQGNDNQNIASTSNPSFLLPREPHMGSSLSAAYMNRFENAITDSSRDYENTLLKTELLRNELVALQQEARRNDFARSEFLINAYSGAEYVANDMPKEGSSGNRFYEMEYLKNSNELYTADNSGVSLHQQNHCPQQSTFSFNQQSTFQQQNIVPFQQKISFQQQKSVPSQQQNTCPQQNTRPQQNMDYSFDEESLGPPSSSYDQILEWSDSFETLDFVFPDSHKPLSVDDYVAEVLAEPINQPKLPD